MVAPRHVAVEEEAVQDRGFGRADARLLLEFALEGLDEGLADLDAAAREMPARHIAVADEQDIVVGPTTTARTPSVIGRLMRKLECATRDLVGGERRHADAKPFSGRGVVIALKSPRRRQWRIRRLRSRYRRAMSFTIAHITDPHLSPAPPPLGAEFRLKRFMGWVNWKRGRERPERHGAARPPGRGPRAPSVRTMSP